MAYISCITLGLGAKSVIWKVIPFGKMKHPIVLCIKILTVHTSSVILRQNCCRESLEMWINLMSPHPSVVFIELFSHTIHQNISLILRKYNFFPYSILVISEKCQFICVSVVYYRFVPPPSPFFNVVVFILISIWSFSCTRSTVVFLRKKKLSTNPN